MRQKQEMLRKQREKIFEFFQIETFPECCILQGGKGAAQHNYVPLEHN